MRECRTTAVGLIVLLVVLAGCRQDVSRRFYEPGDSIPKVGTHRTVMRVHMKSGELYVFDVWTAGSESIEGEGTWHDVGRGQTKAGAFRVPYAGVALFETAKAELPNHVLAMTGMTVGTGFGAVFCLTAPKVCFGSCPTFYVGDSEEIAAEGFSDAIAPSLERSDVDALWGWRPTSRDARLVMRNEALETHVVRHANLLALEKADGEHVLRSEDGEFHRAGETLAPAACQSRTGDCLSLVSKSDREEWFTAADSNDLAARETIDLRFDDVPPGRLGLVVRFRQTLMTTFLFYQAMAYMGSRVWEFFAKLETSPESWFDGAGKYQDIIGRIEVFASSDADGPFAHVGGIAETGPLAINTTMLTLPDELASGGSLDVRLDLVRGNWRLDQIALVELSDEVVPIEIEPGSAVTSGERIGDDGDVVEALTDPEQTVVTLPGDDVTLHYRLPENPERYAYYLDAKGYYIEWMRESWIAEENPWMLSMMLFTPRLALRKLAPKYKEIEADSEKIFWESRYEN